MQHYTISFITVNALHVSVGLSAHHQLAAVASVGELELTHASDSSKQARHITDAVCTVFEVLMMGGETA